MPLNVDRVFVYCIVLFGGAAPMALCEALEVNLTEVRPYVEVNINGEGILVKRNQDTTYTLKGFFAKTSRPCPPFCIRPIEASPEVRTIGEYEIFDFMSHQLRDGLGLILDARAPEWYKQGTIPGATNVPWNRIVEVSGSPEEKSSLLKEFGVGEQVGRREWLARVVEFLDRKGKHSGSSEFSRSKELVVFCNGPWSNQSQRAIDALLGLGYPAKKVSYYRGGMQAWVSLGLTTVVPRTQLQSPN